MNKKRVFELFDYFVSNNCGIKRTKKEQVICECALRRFKRGCLDLSDCYKKPSSAKISAFLGCVSQWRDYLCMEVCSSVLGYNSQAFSWVGLWVDLTPSIDGYVTIYLKYDTAWRSKLIEICSIKYDYVK